MPEYPNALLTASQRDTLLSEDDGNHSRQYRQRIRDRTRAGTADLGILFNQMEARDIRQVFGNDRDRLEELLGNIEEIRLDIVERNNQLSQIVGDMEPLGLGYAYAIAELETTEKDDKESEVIRAELDLIQRHAVEYVCQNTDSLINAVEGAVDDLESSRKRLHQMSESTSHDLIDEDVADLTTTLTDHIDQVRENGEKVVDSIHEVTDKHNGNDPIAMDLVGTLYASISDIEWSFRHILRAASNLQDRIRDVSDARGFNETAYNDVVDAIAFYLRVCENLGGSTGSLLEEAITRMHEREHPDDVVGFVSIDIETERRITAYMRGSAKLDKGDSRLTSTELRAVAENNHTLLDKIQRKKELTKSVFRDEVVSAPENIEDGLRTVVEEPHQSGSAINPDIIAAKGNNVVLLELNRAEVLIEDTPAVLDRVRGLMSEYGGGDRVRVYVVVPDFEMKKLESSPETLNRLREEPKVEVKSFPLNESLYQ